MRQIGSLSSLLAASPVGRGKDLWPGCCWQPGCSRGTAGPCRLVPTTKDSHRTSFSLCWKHVFISFGHETMLSPLLPGKGVHGSPRTCGPSLIRQLYFSPLSSSSSYSSLSLPMLRRQESRDQNKSWKKSLKKKKTPQNQQPKQNKKIPQQNKWKKNEQQQKSPLVHCTGHCFLSALMHVPRSALAGDAAAAPHRPRSSSRHLQSSQPASPSLQERYSSSSRCLRL